MKFCMVSTFYPPYSFGGDGMYVYRLSNELARRGHSVDVFFCQDSFRMMNGDRPPSDLPKNHENVSVYALKSGLGILSPLLTQQTGIPFLKSSLKNALEANGYDVIHYHNMSLIGIKALSYGSAVKLYTMHEHWLVCPMHVLWKLNREVCTTRNCFRCQISGKRPPQFWRNTRLMERMLKHVDCFLSPSRFTLEKHREMGLDAPIKRLPHFLPRAERSEGSDRYGRRRPYFLFVGRLEYIKGVHNLIEAFKKCPEQDLLIAGDGTYRAELEGRAAGASNIAFLGRLEQDELSEAYSRALAVIVPSICYETFGLISIEAFSHRTPVIVNDLGALPEVVNESNGGFTYKSDDELLASIRKLAEDPDLRNELGENGYRAYLERWTEDSHVRQYFELIRAIKDRRVAEEKHVAKPALSLT